jgi:hypothetical protein
VIESQVEYIGGWQMAGEDVLTVFHRHRPRDVIATDVQHFCKKNFGKKNKILALSGIINICDYFSLKEYKVSFSYTQSVKESFQRQTTSFIRVESGSTPWTIEERRGQSRRLSS